MKYANCFFYVCYFEYFLEMKLNCVILFIIGDISAFWNINNVGSSLAITAARNRFTAPACDGIVVARPR